MHFLDSLILTISAECPGPTQTNNLLKTAPAPNHQDLPDTFDVKMIIAPPGATMQLAHQAKKLTLFLKVVLSPEMPQIQIKHRSARIVDKQGMQHMNVWLHKTDKRAPPELQLHK